MPASSPFTATSDLTTFALVANGRELDGSYQVLSIQVVSALNRLPFAQVELVDGSAAQGAFPLSASTTLAPGVTLEVKLGYHGDNQTVFSGVVTRQAIRKRGKGPAVLQVEARDKAVKMTLSRGSAIFTDTTDSEVLGKLIRAHGLSAKVASTSPKLKELTQFYSTDWDFLVTRAEANGMVVAVNAGTVSVVAPDPSTSPALGVTFGTDVLDFRLEEDAPSQWSSVRCSSWDYKSQKMIEATAKVSEANALGSPSSKKLAEVASPSEVEFQSSAPWAQDSLKAWAQGLMLRSELAKIRGEVRFQGSSKVEPGKTLSLEGFGDRFDGTAFLSAVTHDVAEGRWTTRVEVGLEEKPFVETVPVTGPAAAGLLPGVVGLQNGVVKQIDKDPDGNVRVLVQIPVVGMKDGVWARLGSPYATSKAGIFFYPEVGDEVILGFVNEDPGNPIILGSLYSGSKKAPPFTPDAKNSHKAIKTNAGLEILFDEEGKVLTLQTPHGNKLVLSDEGDTITLQDKHENQIKMSATGIEIKSATKLTLTGKTGVSVQASVGNVEISAEAGKVEASGLEVELSAEIELKASGTAKASLQAAGETSIQGALVRIN
ncbi:type VI secretion system tip protein VgrG [Stigmatella sp. ncwal1]|uniref:Type VI secretion system tip protein VgrG n=1 Tax=Stigmatella ashevillensis TaxID=2995309 RepID=A0ABT5DJH6_9BACT|nr:type VI secretion system tip protein VgrG [Stigmatella ashevillena]MDC0713315.1 type VI secretion system tip protein VgrG [Stigmatella ashevillena]